MLILSSVITQARLITPDSPVTVTLDGESAAELVYEATEGETVTLSVRALDADINTVVEILTPDYSRLAYNDDHRTTLDGLSITDSALARLTLPESGMYAIRVNSFNGVSTGEVEVTLTLVDPLETDITETDDVTIIQVSLVPQSVFRYPLTLEEGAIVTLTARDPEGVLDPYLALYDADDALITANDDHEGIDLTLNIFDARIPAFTASEDGVYTLEVREFMGRAGVLEIRIETQ